MNKMNKDDKLSLLPPNLWCITHIVRYSNGNEPNFFEQRIKNHNVTYMKTGKSSNKIISDDVFVNS